MDKIDRLSTLMARFRISVRPAPADQATLRVIRSATGSPDRLFLHAQPPRTPGQPGDLLLSAVIDWGGDTNPLFLALPDVIEVDLTRDPDTRSLLSLIDTELRGARCGAGSVVARLSEVLLVRILRHQIESGSVESGLLAGLSDPRLSRAIVAIHDRPDRQWTNEDLAQVAGLSLSRFVDLFQTRVGETPAAYLRRWRLTLASQDLAEGGRVERVSHRYGFRSPEGFTRAFKRHFGHTPIAHRVAAT